MGRDWVLKFQHTFREDNRVADRLANWGITQLHGLHILPQPTQEVLELLWEDCQGISFPRLVSDIL